MLYTKILKNMLKSKNTRILKLWIKAIVITFSIVWLMALFGKWLISLVGVEMSIGKAMLISMIALFLVSFINGILKIERIKENKDYGKD